MKKNAFRVGSLGFILCLISLIAFVIMLCVFFNVYFFQNTTEQCSTCNSEVNAVSASDTLQSADASATNSASGEINNGADNSNNDSVGSNNGSTQTTKFSTSGATYTDKEVIVTYKNDVTAAQKEQIQDVLQSYGAQEVTELASSTSASDGAGQTVSVSIDEGRENALVEALNNVSGVASAQRNFIYRLTDAESVNAVEEAASAESSAENNPNAGSDSSVSGAVAIDTVTTTNSISGAQSTTSTATSINTQTDSFVRTVSPSIPNDTNVSKQYYLDSWQASSTSSGVNLYKAWGVTHTNQEVSIAILDSGILTTHEDLQENINTTCMANISKVRDNVYKVDQGTIMSMNYHGSHVAGIAAAATNNSKGIAGASYNAKIVPIQIFYKSQNELITDTGVLIKAYSYLQGLIDANKLTNLHVINMSLGGYGTPDSTDYAFEKMIKTMRNDYNIISVIAGGNGDSINAYTKSSYPSDFDESFSVTALNQNGTNVKYSDYNMCKDISAPGINIYSCGADSNSDYRTLGGTSMAAPIVSGIAALLWASQPDLTVNEAVEAMQKTAHALDPNGENYHSSTQTGSPGCIDAYEALNYVITNFGGTSNIDETIITNNSVSLSYSKVAYTGQAVTPIVTVMVGGVVLNEGTDYTLIYYNNTDVGTAYVKVSGTGEYSGGATRTFTIQKAPVTWKSLEGGTALSTMKAIVQECFSSSDAVVIASKDGYWDALSASGLAGLYNCPILLTATDKLSAQTQSEIERLGAETAFIIGGEAAVSADVATSIETLGLSVTRLAGGTAVSTSLAVYDFAKGKWGSNAIVASSASYHDALSIASYAYAKKAPIILAQSKSKTLSARAVKVLNDTSISQVIIVGANAAVSTDVEKTQLSDKTVKRLGGGTAYSTSRIIAQWCINQGMQVNKIGVACGTGYHDALCASALCGKNNSVLILVSDTQQTCINTIIKDYKNQILTAYFFGGEKAISNSLRQACIQASV